ncbi:MAG: hypothetical protein Q8L23_17185 [Caulobacter sp.]|nr:hypothetical protein [Caulobacter sp.]
MPRKRTKAAETADFLRRWALITAFGKDETVEIDGVLINLKCDIDTATWRPLCPLGVYGHPAALNGPEIVFPWTPSDWKRSFRKSGELVEAKAGSLVFIGYVETRKFSTPFADFDEPSAREGKLAYLFVMHEDRSMYVVKRPLLLVAQQATAQLVQMADYSKAFRGLVAKLETATGLVDLEEMVETPTESWPKLQQEVPRSYALAFMAFVDAVQTMEPEAYASFGYMMARAEAEGMLLESAVRGQAARGHQAKAAEARRAASRLATEPLREASKRIIAIEGDISLGRCARLVADEMTADPTWKLNTGQKWIEGHIRELFEHRGAGREYRPKRTQ